MKRVVLFMLLAATAQAQVAELLTVRPNGTLYPSNVVASINSLADTAAAAQAAMAQAAAVAQTAMTISNEVDAIKAMELARNATGYIRLGIESFSPGIEANTNIQASVVLFEQASNDTTYAYFNLWTYYTSNPGVWPYVRTADSVGRTNAWDMLESDNISLGEVLVGSTLYEAYCNQIKLPVATTSAFFRVHADVQGVGTNQFYFPTNNGISPNGETPYTGTITDGTNIMAWTGGIRTK